MHNVLVDGGTIESSGSVNRVNTANIFSGSTRKAGAIASAAPFRMSLSSGLSN